MGLGFRELVIILLIVLVIFGTRRLISAGGDLGKAIQSFKKGMRDAQDDPARLEPPPSTPEPGAAPGTASGAAPGIEPGAGVPSERKDGDRPGV